MKGPHDITLEDRYNCQFEGITRNILEGAKWKILQRNKNDTLWYTFIDSDSNNNNTLANVKPGDNNNSKIGSTNQGRNRGPDDGLLKGKIDGTSESSINGTLDGKKLSFPKDPKMYSGRHT